MMLLGSPASSGAALKVMQGVVTPPTLSASAPAPRGALELMLTLLALPEVETPLKRRARVPERALRGLKPGSPLLLRTVCTSWMGSAELVMLCTSGRAAAVAHTVCTS